MKLTGWGGGGGGEVLGVEVYRNLVCVTVERVPLCTCPSNRVVVFTNWPPLNGNYKYEPVILSFMHLVYSLASSLPCEGTRQWRVYQCREGRAAVDTPAQRMVSL